ncbi:uncharacterized protein LOC102462198 [Pelodiscus sinensis]|uniref:uncharacterized protein LOC102462198 n=1 Tax=Pelodiscus sinensis TaxID=13735 RepID=UPI0003C43F56|nr:uncharacterized protein LOC102462198 [Pelodiscus sinensis]|eukprot:XP_006128639.1 uncharacterized protein LOC102462198 [Pelodiscus sinensis]
MREGLSKLPEMPPPGSALLVLLLSAAILPLSGSYVLIHQTSSGGQCQDACENRGYDYTWCKQIGGNKKKWDYCSLEPGLDAFGKQCATACELWGADYNSCYFKNGKWGYCGLFTRFYHARYSQSNKLCVTQCRATQGIFQCNTLEGIEPCAPYPDVTTRGLPCHSNYRCAHYGHSEYRCHTGEEDESWGYCGKKSLDECVWIAHQTNASQAEFCILSYGQGGQQITFRRERQHNLVHPATEEFQNATYLIDSITSSTSIPDPWVLGSVRLQKLEGIFCKGINYTNLEVQISKSTQLYLPIARVLFPKTLEADEFLRLALYTSLHSAFYPPAYVIVLTLRDPMLCSINTSDTQNSSYRLHA